jgi:bacterial leucyl aminopeptidase
MDATVPTSPSHQAQVTPVIATLSQDNLQTDLLALTSYKTRYYKSPTGATAASELLSKLQSVS